MPAPRLARLTAPFLLAACAATTVADAPPPAAAGAASGKPVNCLTQRLTDNLRVIDTRTILYRVGRQWYRNDLPNECPRLDDRATIITRTTISQICAGDIFEVADLTTHTSYGSCVFGKYTPVTLPKTTR